MLRKILSLGLPIAMLAVLASCSGGSSGSLPNIATNSQQNNVQPPTNPNRPSDCTNVTTRSGAHPNLSDPGCPPDDSVDPIGDGLGFPDGYSTGTSTGGGGGGVGMSGNPKEGQHCEGSQFGIGDPIVPSTMNSANATYYVTDISTIWMNGVIVAVVYAGTTPGSNVTYYFIQQTNNGATYNIGASMGLNFGPASIGVSGGITFNAVSPVQWFTPTGEPGATPLPSGSTNSSCWPADPVPA